MMDVDQADAVLSGAKANLVTLEAKYDTAIRAGVFRLQMSQTLPETTLVGQREERQETARQQVIEAETGILINRVDLYLALTGGL